MAIDWKRTDVMHTLEAVMVSQTNFSQELGKLSGVDWAASTIEAAYYTDLRTSGKLVVYGEGWKRGTFIRIRHSIPETGYKNTIGTYIVTGEEPKRVNGTWCYELTLNSSLVMLADDLLPKPWGIAKNATALGAMKDVLSKSGASAIHSALGTFSGADAKARVAIDDSLADDVKATKAQVMEAGKSRLECLFALCNMSGNRLDVTPEGYISVSRYSSPASKTPRFTIDLTEDRGIVVNGSVARSSDWLSMPDTVVIQHSYSVEVPTGEYYTKSGKREDGTTYKAGDPKTKTEQRTLYAIAKNSNGDHTISKRGYSIVDFRQVNDITPHTLKAASDYAAKALKSDVEVIEWELKTTFLPIWEGDVVNLVINDGDKAYRGTRKCLVKNVSIDLGTMLMSIDLKETKSGDAE